MITYLQLQLSSLVTWGTKVLTWKSSYLPPVPQYLKLNLENTVAFVLQIHFHVGIFT